MKNRGRKYSFYADSMNISSMQFVISLGNYLHYKQMKIIIIGRVAGEATTAARIRREEIPPEENLLL